MQNEEITADIESGHKNVTQRRKRVNCLKIVIIILITILTIIPILYCIILTSRINKIQKQLQELININNNSGQSQEQGAMNTDTLTGGIQNNSMYAKAPQDSNVNRKEIQDSDTLDNSIQLNHKNETDMAIDNTIKNSQVNLDNDTVKIAASLYNAVQDSTNSSGHNNKAEEIKIASTGKQIYAGKKVYLTFDDGPSENTDQILDILAKYKVKAAFFVIGKTDKKDLKRYKRIVKEGHTLGMHSYSHDYKKIYNSLEDFDKDFTKLWKLLYDTTGYKPAIYRFPGGSMNLKYRKGTQDYLNYLKNKSINYYDWNVLNGDATGKVYTEEQLINNVLSGVAVKKTSIVLMHDTQSKDTTVASLPKLLEALISGGAQLLPLDSNAMLIQQIKLSSNEK